LTQRVKAVAEEVPGVTDTLVSRETGSPEELVFVDRLKAADMHLTVSRIADTLQTVLSGTTAGTYRERGDEFDIRVKVDNAEKQDMRSLLDFTVTGLEGTPVVLANVVD